LENQQHTIALYAVWYDFVKMHETLETTLVLAAKVADELWSIDDLVAPIDDHGAARPRRKPEETAA
jgi:hypothetical protein